MRYIVTGGAGYLGLHLVDALIANGHSVIILDNLSNGKRHQLNARTTFFEIDISDASQFIKISDLGNVDGVFHLAARKSVVESINNPELYDHVNVGGTKNVFDFCLRNQINSVVFASSAAVYGNLEKREPITEQDATFPSSPYGVSKLKSEEIARKYTQETSIYVRVLRFFNLAGAGKPEYFDFSGENVIPIILRSIKNRDVFRIFGTHLQTADGTCVRDFVHVQDVVEAMILSMGQAESKQEESFEILNISSGIGLSVKELLMHFESLLNRPIEFQGAPPRNGDVHSSIGDNRRARELLQWEPRRKINQIIRESIDAFEF
jgi:UDP-glucose 4-epimerase